ncbi:glucosidase [Beijerinckia sp. L45]|uniref:MGH1-like glycoside hydrolase domain-containing protein n=1 Tax=Beijerinckia sp. L45 TaxID=1641855 RepID=UPI00131E5FA4|nr:glucosidase [Beijerinckia sp. L45]
MPNAPHSAVSETAEGKRLAEADTAVGNETSWRRFGPYLSDRQWGTVREDYSVDGDAWNYLPHDHARSRAYRWGEDAIAGFGDDQLAVCLGLALWNGKDPILKERLFGLTNAEGNHGEDVKELYYYLDGTPTHSYMRMLYKYPQEAYPYEKLLKVNAQRGLTEREYELIDTGLFDDNRYFDVEVEYAKGAPDDILMQVTIHNRGPVAATLHCLPQLWSRNTWSWGAISDTPKPHFSIASDGGIAIEHCSLPPMHLSSDGAPELLFCDNETNTQRFYGTGGGYFKDGIDACVIGGRRDAVNPARVGTKVAVHHSLTVAGGGTAVVRLRLRRVASEAFADFDAVLELRRSECDAFYDALQSGIADPDARLVQRQAFAGMLWSKQYYGFNIRDWLNGDPNEPRPPMERLLGRDIAWGHLHSADILSMPDAWEYPWFASWDLAFHCVTFALIDPAFAKAQLVLLTQSRFMHPNGQLPAYEWKFGDTNPPIHALAALQIYDIDRALCGVPDRMFLRRVFNKLALNFTWWVNVEDMSGRNIFEGGFLGLDNISLFDRSGALPEGGHINQADGTAWAAVYALNLMRMALEIALEDHVYEDMAIKFFEHFLLIAGAVHRGIGNSGLGLWDETDGFYYDVLEIPGEPELPLRVRSMVGLIPLFAVEILHQEFRDRLPDFNARLKWLFKFRPDLASLVSRWKDENSANYTLLALMRRQRLNQVLARMLDETEFLSDYGIRSVSKYHLAHPAGVTVHGEEHTVAYTPGESNTRLFGGNSNWRGPIWMPVNFMIVVSLHRYHTFYGDEFVVEHPVGSGNKLTLDKVAHELAGRLTRLFLRNAEGRRPYLGESRIEQDDPHFRDKLLFHEHFHGDSGRGLGASHQTGWTGLVALLLHPRHEIDPGAQSGATKDA